MKFDCRYSWKSVTKSGNATLKSGTVNICGCICDSGDLCGIVTCEFYDISPDATRRFLQNNDGEHTLEQLLIPIN